MRDTTVTLPTVLLVDDDQDSWDLTKRLLAKAGVLNQVVVRSNGADALVHLKNCCMNAAMKPAVILLDIRMPLMSGFEVLQWIRANKALQGCKVIIWSSSEDDQDVTRAKQCGADGYFTKYASWRILGDAVRAFLAHVPSDPPKNAPPDGPA